MENSEFETRRRAVAECLSLRKLDALLVSFSPNLRYLSGFTGSNGALLVLPGKSILFTDPRYEIQASLESTAQVRILKASLTEGILAAIRRLGVRRIGYEPARMTCEFYDAIHSKLPAKSSLVPVRGWIEEFRMRKSPAELALIRQSVRTNSQAFEWTVARLKSTSTESGLAAELEYRMRRFGAEKPSFESIVAGGERSALPHAQPSDARLAGLVVVDMGAFQHGYASDMTRMLHIGAPGAKAKKMYDAVLEAQLAAIDAVRDGVRTVAVDAAARRVLKGHGLDRLFTHSTGHGLGLEIHEPPRLGRRDKLRLKEGMAITIEPGVYEKGFGGVRIEDTVVVTKNGCEILTPTPKTLTIV